MSRKMSIKFAAMLTGLTIMLGASTTTVTFANGFCDTTKSCTSQCGQKECDVNCKDSSGVQNNCTDCNESGAASCKNTGAVANNGNDNVQATTGVKDYNITNFECNSVNNIIKKLSGCATNTPNTFKWNISNSNLDVKAMLDKMSPIKCDKPILPTPKPTVKPTQTPNPVPTQTPVEPTVKPTPTPTQTPVEPTVKPTPVPTPNPTMVPPTESNSNWKAVQDKILMYTNIERQKNGLSPLSYNGTVEKYAVDKSTDMAINNYFDHKSPSKGYFYDIWKKDGFKYSAGAENIYYTTGYKGVDADSLAKDIVNGWMNSAGHRANILNAKYTDLGVGVAEKNGKLYATQLFYTK